MQKVQELNGELLENLFEQAVYQLQIHKEEIDLLNVFPVPDGDTGTNMLYTLQSTLAEIKKQKVKNIKNVAEASIKGSLMGARGNSGVILSQIIRGFAEYIKNKDKIDADTWVKAWQEATRVAYRAVLNPTEGTILTVLREGVKEATLALKETKDILVITKRMLDRAKKALADTPNLLPILKEAQVVDAGGQGLVYFWEGFLNGLMGKKIELKEERVILREKPDLEVIEKHVITYQYCTEFIILSQENTDFSEFKNWLYSQGDSIVTAETRGMLKVHIHTNNPGKILDRALELGSLSQIKIDNMAEQHEERLRKEIEPMPKALSPKKDVGFVVVSWGEGLNQIFNSFSVDFIINGGQTLNPSVEAIKNAVEKINADKVFLFPNNKNVILAAQQVENLYKDKVIIIPTKHVLEGIRALVEYNPKDSWEQMKKKFEKGKDSIRVGEITRAIRNTSINGFEISEGDILGLINDEIAYVGKDINEVAINLVEKLLKENGEVLTIYYGQDISKEEAQELYNLISQKYSSLSIELIYGGQPYYYYYLGLE
ncbi:MAG: DAK2 domain-containing protein [Dictyoglomus sp.]|nr:DAK2 domain-containing protein [Dictyoglomus sp.]MCX7941911.1 DAK2 domain-containing protein [Dictyoglomaceae bacterium]MDW8188602.1 DAK2 domain-containing protein [Dictyoglomus sp.]